MVDLQRFPYPKGNFTAPTYRVLSAGLSGEVAYYGVVDASDNSSKSVSFSIDTNATGDSVYPFAADGVFDPTFLLPKLTAVVSSGSLTSVSINYYGTMLNPKMVTLQGLMEVHRI